MVENLGHDLSYGQLGDITYDSGKKQWRSSRDLRSTETLKSLGAVVLYVPPSSSELPEKSTASVVAVFNHRATRRLAKAFPETDPAISFLKNCLPNAYTLKTDDRYNAILGNLMSVGRARGHDPTSGGRRDVIHNILAISGGEVRDGIKLLEMRPSRQGWENDQTIWINTFTLKSAEAAWWVGDGTKVLQVCFAENVDHDSTLLAIRFATSITILRPLYVTIPLVRSTSRLNLGGRSISRIDPNPLITIKLPTDSGKYEFVDVMFNPWYQRQLAAIDSSGSCIIWTLSGSTLLEQDTLRCGMEDLSLAEEEGGNQTNFHDGWHKIAWIGNARTFIVCNRYRLEAFEIRGLTVVNFNKQVLNLQREEWILDVRKSPFMDNDLFIVTTLHLYLIRFRSRLDFQDRDRYSSSFLDTIWKLSHNRAVVDLSLRIHLYNNLNDTVILLHSRSSPLVTIHPCGHLETSTSISDPISDPALIETVHFNTMANDSTARNTSATSDLFVLPCSFGVRPFEPTTQALGSQYRNQGYSFFQTLQLGADLELTGCLCFSRTTSLPSEWQNLSTRVTLVTMPNWTSMRKRYNMRRKALVPDDFIVPDGEASDSGLDATEAIIDVFSHEENRADSTPANRSSNNEQTSWTMPYSTVYERLINVQEGVDEKATTSTERVVDAIVTAAHDQVTLKTLYDLVCNTSLPLRMSDEFTLVSDVAIARNAKFMAHPSRVQLSSLSHRDALGLHDVKSEEISISSILRTLVANFLTPLSSQTPVETRSALRAMAREAAQGMFFATIGARLHKAEPGISNTRLQEQVQSSALPLPSQVYLPTPSMTPSVDPDTSKTQEPDEVVSRLRAYTSITHPAKAINQTVTNTLDHWSVGSDPSDYNWEQKTAELSGERVIAGSAMSAIDQEKQQRRQARFEQREEEREKRRKRLRLEPATMNQQPMSGLSQDAWMSSQPRAPAPFFDSQASSGAWGQDEVTAGAGSQVVASQIEIGRYGGRQTLARLPVRTKGPRKAGF